MSVVLRMLLLPSLLVIAGASACGGGDADGVHEAAVAMERLVGRYAHYDVVAYESPSMKTLIVSYGFTDLWLEGGELIAKESFCRAEHRSDQPIKTTLSDAATRAIEPKSTAVEVSVVDDRFTLYRPETPTGLGIRLENPETESLPTDPRDPRIADDDRDGKPGVTVQIEVSNSLKGELYIARREIFAYQVEEQPDGSLIGTVSDRSEQLAIGASNEVFLSRDEWIQHPDPTRSPIILHKVTEDWDCDRLLEARDGLFPPTPEVDW